MRQHLSQKAICLALSVVLAGAAFPVEQAQAQAAKKQQSHPDQSQSQNRDRDRDRDRDRGQQQHTLSAAEAAARAKSQYGGKVLKVSPSGSGYQVKLLTDTGRVITVKIRD